MVEEKEEEEGAKRECFYTRNQIRYEMNNEKEDDNE